jgi:hypothetical protein
VDAYDGATPIFLRGTAAATSARTWYCDYALPIKTNRGLPDREDLLHAATFEATPAPEEALALVFSTEADASLDGAAARPLRAVPLHAPRPPQPVARAPGLRGHVSGRPRASRRRVPLGHRVELAHRAVRGGPPAGVRRPGDGPLLPRAAASPPRRPRRWPRQRDLRRRRARHAARHPGAGVAQLLEAWAAVQDATWTTRDGPT